MSRLWIHLLIVPALAASGLLGCEARDAARATKKMPAKMDETLESINATHSIAERSALARAIEMMDKDDILAKLSPAPTDMLLWALVFGEYISAKDLATYFYVIKKDIEEVLPEKDMSGQAEKPYTDDQISKIRRQKQGRWMELMAVAGLAPQATIVKLVQEQIYANGRYQREALNILMMRAWFLVDVLLDRSLMKNGLPTVGHVKDTLEVLNKVQWILDLPFSSHISFSYNLENIVSLVPELKIDPAQLKVQGEFDQRLKATWREALMKARKGADKAQELRAQAGSLPQAPASEWQALIKQLER
ncbi:MAG: hypothetical protein AB7N80_09580 [Bdellovibrionales bacterium]